VCSTALRHRKEKGVSIDSELWYDYVPKSVETSHEGNVTLLWNQQAQTDRTTLINRRDIIMRDKDDAISGDRNMIKKEAQKITKHIDLTVQIQRL